MILDVSGWQIVSSDGSSFTFPDGSLVSADNTVTIPFLVSDQQEIFFITAGGGQFSGKNTLVVNEDQEEVNDNTAEKNSPDSSNTASKSKKEKGQEKEHTSSEDSSTTTDSDVRIIGSKNLLSSGTSRIVSEGNSIDSDSDAVTNSVSKTRMVVIWVLLLTAIILIALAPLLFTRREKKKSINE